MFQKIEASIGPGILHPGAALICYPVDGRKCVDINLSDIENFVLYVVTAIRDEIISLQLAEERIAEDTGEMHGRHIIKYFNELIEEGSWWTRLAF